MTKTKTGLHFYGSDDAHDASWKPFSLLHVCRIVRVDLKQVLAKIPTISFVLDGLDESNMHVWQSAIGK